MRTFVALRLGPRAEATLADALASLRGVECGVRWSRIDQLHVTLVFLGEVSEGRRSQVVAALRRVVSPPLRLGLEGVGVFPPRGAPRVLWAGLGGDLSALHELQRAVGASLAEIGFPPEERPYRPHVTVGRVRRPDGLELAWRALQSLELSVVPEPLVAFHLVGSEPGSGGPVYSDLATFPLSGQSPAAGT